MFPLDSPNDSPGVPISPHFAPRNLPNRTDDLDGWKWGQAPIVVIGASPHFPQYPRQDSNLELSAPEAAAKISENQSGATTHDDSQPPGCFPWCQGVSHDLPRSAAIFTNWPAKSFWRGEIQAPLRADPGRESCR